MPRVRRKAPKDASRAANLHLHPRPGARQCRTSHVHVEDADVAGLVATLCDVQSLLSERRRFLSQTLPLGGVHRAPESDGRIPQDAARHVRARCALARHRRRRAGNACVPAATQFKDLANAKVRFQQLPSLDQARAGTTFDFGIVAQQH